MAHVPTEYEQLVEFLGRQFTEIDRRFDQIAGRFDQNDPRFDHIDGQPRCNPASQRSSSGSAASRLLKNPTLGAGSA